MRYLVTILLLFFTNCFYSQQKGIIPNLGQWRNTIDYKIEIENGESYFEKNKFTFITYNRPINHDLNDTLVYSKVSSFNFPSSTWSGLTHTESKATYYYNYFLGNDSSSWVSSVYPVLRERLIDFYPKIDLILSTTINNQLQYEFEVLPTGKLSELHFSFSNIDSLRINENGDLLSYVASTEIKHSKPIAWQVINGVKLDVPIAFKILNDQLFFDLTFGYDTTAILYIDPVLTFSTFTGSVSDNWGFCATPTSTGDLVAGSIVMGSLYPITPTAFDNSYNGGVGSLQTDVAISLFNPSGTSLLFSTFLGGSRNETPHSLIVADDGSIYTFGATSSLNFPTSINAYDLTFNGGTSIVENSISFPGADIFVNKLNATGTSLLASTYIGGSGNDGLNTGSLKYNYGDQFRGEIQLDNFQNPIVVSTTQSSNFPVSTGVLNGSQDAIVFKFNTSLSSLYWSTYVGGSNLDSGNGIAIDLQNNVFISGGTKNHNSFPGSIIGSFSGGISDGFISKLNGTSGVVGTTRFIGTNLYDQLYFVQIDNQNDLYVFGQSNGSIPISSGKYGVANSGQFIQKYSNDLATFYWNTLIGGGGNHIEISPTAFLVSNCGNIYISGWGGVINQIYSQATNSGTNNFPVTANAYQSSTNGSNFYLAVLAPNATSLKYATFMGGANSSYNHVDGGTSRFDKTGKIYHAVCGGCGGNDYGFTTTPGVWSVSNPSSNCNLAAFKFDLNDVKAVASISNTTFCGSGTVVTHNFSQYAQLFNWSLSDGQTSNLFEPSFSINSPGQYALKLVVIDTTECFQSDSMTVNFSIHPKYSDTITVDICQGESYLFGGITRTTAGFYSQNLSSTFGCDSIKNLQLIVHPKFTDTITVDICQGESYLFGGVARTTSGFYTQNLTSTFGCDSIINLQLIVHPKFADTITVDICQGESFLFGGVARTTSGFYMQNFTSTFGCDSIKNLHLIVHPKFYDTITAHICQGGSYFFGGIAHTTSGFYTQNLTTVFGCDSIKHLQLIVHPKFSDTVTVDICQGESYLFGGVSRTTSGFYAQNFTTTFGCDSIKNLQLIVHPKFTDTITVDICQGESFVFGGVARTTSGFYAQNLSTTFGCDSIKNLQLIVHPKYADTITVDICQGESYLFCGVSRTTSGFYSQNLSTTFGCDSIKNLQLIVHPKFTDTVTVDICQGESYLFGGVSRTTSGFYAQNFTTTFGCDSIKNLQLIVHPKFADTVTVDICQGESYLFGGVARTTSGFYTQNFTSTFGCDSIKNLHLIVHPKFADTITVDICQGESFLFGGVARTTSGFYMQNFTSTFGCDSIKNLHLIVHPKFYDTITAHICQGGSYFFGGIARTTSGFYSQNLSTTFGCDSIKNLQLIVNPKFADTVTVDICQGESYLFGGVARTTSGFYTQNLTTTFGCDSIKNLHLIVHPKYADTITVDICQGESYLFCGVSRTTSGFYTQNLTTTFGCDSIKNLQLIVHPKFTDTLTVDICQGESFVFGGVARTTSGFYTQNLTTTFGCDSIKHLQLIVHPKYSDTITAHICQGSSYQFGGIARTTSGFYTQNLTTVFGCDSIKHLQLIVHPKYADTITVDICQGESYLFDGVSRTTSGFYTQNLTTTFGCDSIKNLQLIVHPKFTDTLTVDICQGESFVFGCVPRTTSGFYAQNFTTIFGCDSIKNLQLIVHPKFADTVTVDICQGESYLFGGVARATSGFYTQNFTSTFGCDSIKNLHLIVHPKFNDTVTVDICQGESYLFGGVARATSGFYTLNFTSTFGCDSIKNLQLIVHPKFNDTVTVDICQGESYLFDGVSRTTSGFYTQNLTSTFGCDSIKNLQLIVHPKFADTVTVDICQSESYLFGGVARTTSGFYTQNFTTTFGCDSIKNLQLIVHPKFTDTVTVDICQGESYLFGGVPRTTSGFYTQNLTTTFGCDSIKNLHLIVHQKYSDTVTVAICQGESYLFGGTARTSSGFYTQNLTTTFGCDSIKNLQLIVHPKFESTNTITLCEGEVFLFQGNPIVQNQLLTQTLTSATGCDSIINYQIIFEPLPQANFTYILAELSDFSQLVTFSSTNQNLSSYSWNVDGEIVGNQANQSYYWDVFSDSIIVVNLSVTNQLGCSFQHEENIFFSPPVLLYAPNAFTPDGGGFNTTYQPIFNRPDLVDEYFFQIINRWGEVIFSTSDLNDSWDGTFKGLVVQDGVYSWKIEYDASGKKHQLLGHVTVLR